MHTPRFDDRGKVAVAGVSRYFIMYRMPVEKKGLLYRLVMTTNHVKYPKGQGLGGGNQIIPTKEQDGIEIRAPYGSCPSFFDLKR